MWEQIERESGSCATILSSRLNVPGGWLVRSFISSSYGAGIDHIFISDPMHSWKIEEKEVK